MSTKIKMNVINNADLKIGGIKINAVSSSAIVIFGDAECFSPRNVSITRGVRTPIAIPNLGTGGPVGAIR
ncbi:MAG TPA: hypothetical protein VFV52_11015 [Bacilli bacterium]|nr:hypothetical protein [Bacilli bacterium]